MKPQLNIYVFGKRINSFIFFGIVGYICGVLLGVFLGIKLQLNVSVICIMSLISFGVFFLLTYVVKVILGKENIVYYHHEIAITLCCALALLLLKVSILVYVDIMILGIGAFLIFGRLGCFSVGCCHGKPCKYGVTYGAEHVKHGFTWYYKNIRLFPVQFIESCFAFFIVIIGSVMLIYKAPAGTVFLFYSVTYALFRFCIEFFRGDAERPIWLGASEAQWTSVIIVNTLIIATYFNWFPNYAWHSFAGTFLNIALVATIVIYFSKHTERLISPKHILEIGKAVSFLNESSHEKNVTKENVTIYKTSQGMQLSKGIHSNGVFYTISYHKKITNNIVIKIAKLLKLFSKKYTNFSINNNHSKVYHVLFWSDKGLN